MKIQNVVITLFNFRGKEAFKRLLWPGLNFSVNPLNPKSLKFRTMLFEMVCLPGILSQTDQDFIWIIIIDKELPEEYKSKLQKLVKPKQQAIIWEYDPQVKIESFDWLKPFFKNEPDYLITSNLDDDDILSPTFIESTKRHLKDIEQAGKLPTLKLAGSKCIVQWDLIHSAEEPLGWRSPWHRKIFHSSCGFSLMGKYPQVDFNVLGIVHRRAEKYIDFSLSPKNKNISFHQNRLREAFNKNNDDPNNWTKDDLLFDLGQISGPVLMTNHKYNAQYGRLCEKKSILKKVTGPETFPEFAIDWDCANKNATQFTFDASIYLKRKWQDRLIKLEKRINNILNCFY